MRPSVDTVRVLSQAVLVGLGFLTLVQMRRRRSAASGWLAASFCVLALVIVASQFIPRGAQGTAIEWVIKGMVAVLLLFPYCLYRFMATFRAQRTVGAAVLTGAVVAWTLGLGNLPAAGEPRTAAYGAYVVAVLLQWTLLSGAVAFRLWGAGRGQPMLTRRRMRMLSLGSIVLNLALFLGALAPGEPGSPVATATQVIAIVSGIFFYLGFAPPRPLRTVWRSVEEVKLRRVEAGLMSVMTAEQVGDALLPHIAGILGGKGAAILDNDGNVVSTYSFTPNGAPEAPSRSKPAEELRLVDGVAKVRLKTGTLVVEASPYAPFFGRDEFDLLTSLGTLADLALQRVEVAETERRTREAAQRLNAELESFIYSVSHDLKSPLISVLGYLDFFERDYGPQLDDEGRRYIERVSASAMYMHELIVDLLELSRIGRVEADSASEDIEQLIHELTAGLRIHHPHVTVAVGPLPHLSMSPIRARQLFSNLLDNAVVHGGKENLRITVDGRREGDGSLLLSVADDGQGVPREYREKVFGVFERLTTSDAHHDQGTGIGLAICRRIVEHHGGTIWLADSRVGANVCIRLPAAIAEPVWTTRGAA